MYFRSPSQTLAHDRSSSAASQATKSAVPDQLDAHKVANGSGAANGAVNAAAQ